MTHYEALGIPRSATADDVKRAFRERARSAHPDKGGNPADFRRIEEARAVLSDPTRRAVYDAALDRPRATDEAWRAVEEVVGPIDAEGAARVLDALFGDMLDRAKERVSRKIQEAVEQSTRRRK